MIKQKIGIVSQDTQLFAGTIRNNLLFVSPEATEEECLRVLEQAQLLNLVQENPR